jgi:OOP family OmpA-OmpF porin
MNAPLVRRALRGFALRGLDPRSPVLRNLAPRNFARAPVKRLAVLALGTITLAVLGAAPLMVPGIAHAQTQSQSQAPATLQPPPGAYVRDSQGVIVRNSNVGDPRIGNLCWRTGYWTPAQALRECDPQLFPAVDPPPPRIPETKTGDVVDPPIAEKKQTFSADVFFDFDKAVIKPQGKAALDGLIVNIAKINLEVVIAVGHTDGIGSDAYNHKLSVRRAEAVKAYLVSKGIAPNRVYTEGKGKTQPRAANNRADGRAQNRRVEIEVVGTGR